MSSLAWESQPVMVEAYSQTAPSGALREVGGNMGETLSLFGDEQLAGDAASKVKVAFADRVEFRSVEDAASLFDGFRTMKAITWSYGLGMVVRQMRKFEHVELVFGCAEMLEDNVKLSALATLVQQAEAIKALQSRAGREISERVEAGTCELFFENTARSHQKLYLLADEDAGAFRVITGSANLSSAAWSGDEQKEVIACFEGKDAHDSFLREVYEPFRSTCAERVADLKAILDRADERGVITPDDLPVLNSRSKVVVIEQAGEDAGGRVSMQDCALLGGLGEADAKALESTLNLKGGDVLVDGSVAKALKLIGREIGQARVEELASCPRLVVRDDGLVTFNGKKLASGDFARDAATFVEFVDSYDTFTGDVGGWKADTWKISCWYFATPFFPRLRRACRGARQDGRVSSLPMYLVLFGAANAGKTALMRFLAKAMCGKDARQLPGIAFKSGKAVKEVRSSTVRKPRLMQINQQGLPVLYDDVPGSELNDSALRKLLIDSQEEAYDERYPHYPAVVATTNIPPAMPREFRKRALFFESRASLSQLDAIANGHIPSNLTEAIGPSMFAEYAARMAPAVNRLCDGGEIGTLNIYRTSSETLIGILEEAGCRPTWAVPLSNEDYYGEEAQSGRAVRELVEYFRANPGCFSRNARENKLFVKYPAGDRNTEKLLRGICNSMPPRCGSDMITGMLTLNLREAESICGRKFKERSGLLELLGL